MNDLYYIMTENPKLKMYYFYSKSYLFYHEHIQERLSQTIDLKSIEIEDIKENPGGHHFRGLTIKIELVIDAIRKNLGETIVFSDATIFVHSENGAKLNDYLKQFNEYDLVLIDEPYNKLFNIGFLTIKCNDKTLQFFKAALDLIITKQIDHDQPAINHLLNTNTTDLKFTTYDNKIYCDFFREKWRNEFIIYKSFINNCSKKNNFNQRIELFYNLKLIDKNTFDTWYII